MPVTPTYPGVYIEEIPSGVRTITGVATSITAFVGRALRGETDRPVTINNFGDFQRNFGGLWGESSLGFAVRDFFLNGGGQAIIVRVFEPESENDSDSEEDSDSADAAVDLAGKATITYEAESLTFVAASPGKWGNYLKVSIDKDISADLAIRFGLVEPLREEGTAKTREELLAESKGVLFNLTVEDTKTGLSEQFRNVSIAESPRRLDRVLKNGSDLLRLLTPLPITPLTPPVPATPLVPPPASDSSADGDEDTPIVLTASGGDDGDFLTKETVKGDEDKKEGMYALKDADIFNILCIPPYYREDEYDSKDVKGLMEEAAKFCQDSRAFLIVNPPPGWKSKTDAKDGFATDVTTRSNHAALFFPMLRQPNPLRDNQLEDFAPCGAVAGIFARTDAQRGVWKAPAGLLDGRLVGVPQLSVPLTNDENGELNPLGINCLRTLPPAGRVVWGARTLEGDDRLASEWKYIPVRRLALFIEESLYRGTQWAVFEPNDEPLWAQLRLNIGAFMQNLFRQGAFQGSSPKDAYLVKCDSETTTQNDINLGIVNVTVGFAPLKPAEFVILRIQQLAGQIDT